MPSASKRRSTSRPARIRTTRPAARAAALVASLACASLAACAPRVTPPDPFKGGPRPTPTAVAIAPPASPVPTLPPAGPGSPGGNVENPCGAFSPPPAPAAAAKLHTVTFVDVGQGDGAIIRTAGGKTIVMDAGDRDASGAMLKELQRAGVKRIDLLVASHPHLDHIGGMEAILDRFPVRVFADPGTDHTTDAYRNLLLKVKEKKVPYQVLRAGKFLKLGDEGTLSVLFPGDELVVSKRSNENANSLVMKLTFGTVDVLFTGDAEPETLGPVAAAAGSVEVLKIAHHGSRFGTSSGFLRAVTPGAAVISVSARNDYKHPHTETVALLTGDCVPTFRTDRDGTVTLQTDGTGWSFSTERGAAFATAMAAFEQSARDEDVKTGKGGFGPRPSRPPPKTGPAVAGPVVASSRGKVYHPAGCAHVARIKAENRVEYSSAAEAEEAGLRAGSGCRAGAPE